MTVRARLGLEERELDYVVQVKGATSARPADAVPLTPAYQGRGRPPKARYPEKPTSLREMALAAGAGARRPVTWREGEGGPLSSRSLRWLFKAGTVVIEGPDL